MTRREEVSNPSSIPVSKLYFVIFTPLFLPKYFSAEKLFSVLNICTETEQLGCLGLFQLNL